MVRASLAQVARDQAGAGGEGSEQRDEQTATEDHIN